MLFSSAKNNAIQSIMTIAPSVNNDRIILTIALSALAHLIVISAIKLPPPAIPPEEISLNFIEPAPQNPIQRQLVTMPEHLNPAPPKETRLTSEKYSFAEKESLKRGDLGGLPGAPQPKTVSKMESKTEPSQNQKAKSPPLAKMQPSEKKPLRLRDENLLAKYAKKEEKKSSFSEQTPTPPSKEFSRAPGSGAAFFGTAGVPDYLPELPDGDLTLLNTKAVQFAVFVQRVAVRVFGEMRQAGWELLRAADIAHIAEDAVVEAVIDKTGNIVSINVKNSSGSSRFDGVLREAVRKGIIDRNPPAAAAKDDGNIHFEFHSRSWVRPIITPRGVQSEQRWLLLGTGLR